MSRYREYDDDSPEAVLAYGRWQRNARAVLKSKRGRKALAEIRDALLALPDKRLISGAMCTVGAPEVRFPDITDEEIAEQEQRRIAFRAEAGLKPAPPEYAAQCAQWKREEREEKREDYQKVAEREGPGCCVNGALLWHRKVKGGMDSAEAFASLPALVDSDSGDPLSETAELAQSEAGLTYTLAWELAYRNDETYDSMTPEERYAAFLAWIEQQLSETAAR